MRRRPYPTREAWQADARRMAALRDAGMICRRCNLNPLELDEDNNCIAYCVACNWSFEKIGGQWHGLGSRRLTSAKSEGAT